MYFNYPSECILPNWLEKSIECSKTLIAKADENLKYGIFESFERIPFNLVEPGILRVKLQDDCEKFLKASEKTTPRNVAGEYLIPTRSFHHYRSLLEHTFDISPFSLLVKKGVSSGGKEALVLCHEIPFPFFLFRTVYPLCWNAINENNKFPISKHPIYPLFYRFMQEPLAIAMSLSVIENAFDGESGVRESIVDEIRRLPVNYSAGISLYNSGLHQRWKDWRDDSKHCLDKIDAIERWIDLLSNSIEAPDSEQLFTLWTELFDLTSGELQGLKAVPIISENKDLSRLLHGLFDYAIKHPNEFKNEEVRQSINKIAVTVYQLVCEQITIDDADCRLPRISDEFLIRDFIGNVMSGWSFAQDLHDGCFRIYGPAIMAIVDKNSEDDAKHVLD